MRTIGRLGAVAAAALALGGCVSIEEAPMAAGAIQKDQRLILAVFGPPGPVISEVDSKGETAAKIVPGLGLIVKDAQDQRDLKTSKDLQQYMPAWEAGESLYPILLEQLTPLGLPGKIVGPQEAELPPGAWARFNQASDVLDWQLRYYFQQPDHVVTRNYSSYLQLDDALVLEVNVAAGLESDGEGNLTPCVKAVTRLLRVNNMRQLWRHESAVNEASATRILYDFQRAPGELVYTWQKLLPVLAGEIVSSLAKNLRSAGVALEGTAAPAAPAGPEGSAAPTTQTGALPYGVPEDARAPLPGQPPR